MSKDRRTHEILKQPNMLNRSLATSDGSVELKFHPNNGRPTKNSLRAIKLAVKNRRGLVYIEDPKA